MPFAKVRIGRAGGAPIARPHVRIPLAKATVDDLAALAMQTTVPATEQSRSDAGAKIDDND